MENENINQEQNPEIQDPEVQDQETMSFTDKLIGIFIEPVKVFKNIAGNPIKTSDWILPIIIIIVLSIAAQMITLNNPLVQENMKQEMLKRFQKSIDEGKMTQEQAEQIMDNMDKYKGFQYIGIFVFVPIMMFVITFLAALFYWILARAGLKGDPNYMSVVTIYSLTSVISIIEILITTILAITLGKLNTVPSLALIMPDMADGPLKILMGKINPFTFWWLILMGIGLAKLSKNQVKNGIIWVFGLWLVYVVVVVVVIPAVPFLRFLGGN
jgi:hypothetical protein